MRVVQLGTYLFKKINAVLGVVKIKIELYFGCRILTALWPQSAHNFFD